MKTGTTAQEERDREIAALKTILDEDSSSLMSVGDSQSDKGFTFDVVDVNKGENRRWSRTITVTTRSGAGRFWQWDYEQGLTEHQDADRTPSDPIQVNRVEREVTKVVMTYEPVEAPP